MKQNLVITGWKESFYFEKKKKMKTKIILLILSNKKYYDKKFSVFNPWQSLYLKCHFVFLINWNTKLEIKFWFSFLYWSWDIKNKTKPFFHFKNNWTLKFKFEVRFSFFILIWKTKSEIYSKKYLMKLVAISPYSIRINKRIK